MAEIKIENPLLLLYREKDGVVCHIHATSEDSYQGYGLLIADIVRHVANAFHVTEDDVWEWVDKERFHPTTAWTWNRIETGKVSANTGGRDMVPWRGPTGREQP